MSQELAVTQNNNLWDCDLSLKEIKELYAHTATDNEFKMFVSIGRIAKLNPYLREIWCIKYGTGPAAIFIGRDGYRKNAQAHPAYDYHHVDAVYANDDFHYNLRAGDIEHRHNFKDRGALVGAYCITQRKGSSKPIYVFVDLKEYNTGKSNWATKPATMIKKVAEAQCLRMAFQELFAGTYGEGELDLEREKDITAQSHAEKTQEHHRTFEGQPLSQSHTMDEDALQAFLTDIAEATEKSELQNRYRAAKEAAKGDKIASNKISVATKKRLAELQQEIDNAAQPVQEVKQETSDWQKEYDEAQTA